MCPSGRGNRHNLIELLRELRHVTIVVISAAHVYQLLGLLLNCAHHFRMAMARRTDRNSGVAIEENVSIDIFYPNSPRAFGNELEGRSGIRRGNELCIRLDNLAALRTWKHRFYFWSPRWSNRTS